MIGRIRAHAAEIVVILLVVAAGVGLYAYAHRDEGRLEESKQRGAAIVEALESYRAGTGAYPASLDDLVPQHIAVIEQPTWGLQRWRYRPYSPDEDDATQYFQLSVAAQESGYPVLFYDFVARRWVLNN